MISFCFNFSFLFSNYVMCFCNFIFFINNCLVFILRKHVYSRYLPCINIILFNLGLFLDFQFSL